MVCCALFLVLRMLTNERCMLACEALCLSAQSVISLRLKTLLKHVGSVLFLLNSAGFLSVKNFGC